MFALFRLMSEFFKGNRTMLRKQPIILFSLLLIVVLAISACAPAAPADSPSDATASEGESSGETSGGAVQMPEIEDGKCLMDARFEVIEIWKKENYMKELDLARKTMEELGDSLLGGMNNPLASQATDD